MSKRIQKKSVLLASLAVGLACGTAFAATQHTGMVLRDRAGTPITPATVNNAFSMQATCSACHNGTNNGGTTKLLSSYSEIERHNYHAQTGSNEFRGFNPYNPDSGDAFRTGAAAPGKSWVQSPGHFGSW
ncbi:MAG: cytochrome C [Geobacteraceae bacterium]|nr:cytochrome C [Geobacteraceae bacterium]NTW79650.1 cytochrome C [Geobacteraceae bacterium]